jgi:hypothetical protein
MLRRKGPFITDIREFEWVGEAIEDIQKGILPTHEKLTEIDATVCWMSACWEAVDQVANHLISSNVLPRHYFDIANLPGDIPLFTCYRNNFKAMIYFELGRYAKFHCSLFRYHIQHPEFLPSKDIVHMPWYWRPAWWLLDGCAFGKVPRAKFEEALSAVPSMGFIKECSEGCESHSSYDYKKWTSWNSHLERFIPRMSFTLICGRDKEKEE